LNYVPKFRGYEHSLSHGMLSKIGLQKNIPKHSILQSQDYLKRNVVEDYEYFDIIKSSMNIPLSQSQDANGNTYITGSSGNTIDHSGDITTIKINQDGTIVWTLRIPSPDFTVNFGTHLSFASDGNIILTGYIWNNNSMDVICAKISINGEIIWQNIISND